MNNQTNPIIIPDSINKVKGSIWGWFTWTDLLFAIFPIFVIALPLILGSNMELKNLAIYGGVDLVVILIYIILIYPILPGKRKLYQLLGNMITHAVENKKYGKKSNPVKYLVPFNKVDGNILLGNHSSLGVIKLKGKDIFLKSSESQALAVQYFSDLLHQIDSEIDFAKVDRRSDYNSHSTYLLENINTQIKSFLILNKSKIPSFQKKYDQAQENDSWSEFLEKEKDNLPSKHLKALETKLDALALNIQDIDKLNEEEYYETTYFMIFKSSSKEKIGYDLGVAEAMLQQMGHKPKVLEGGEILSFMSSYYKKNNSKLSASKELTFEDILPSKLTFKSNHIIQSFDNGKKQYLKIASVSTLPTYVSRGWISELFNSVEGQVFVKTEILNSPEAIDKINKKIKVAEVNELGARDESSKHSTSRSVESLRSLMADLQNGNTIQRVNIYFQFFGDSKEEVLKKYISFRKRLRSYGGYQLNPHNFTQKQAYISSIPRSKDKLMAKSSLTIPTHAISEGYPMTNATFQDNNVPILGYGPNGSPIFLDIKIRADDRVNSSMTIIGQSGGGKSFLVKKLTKDLIATGFKVLIIDPENEYTNLAKTLDGQTINMGQGRSAVINPLQSFDKDEENGAGAFTNHITHIQRFLTMAAGLTEIEASFIPKLAGTLFDKAKITPKNIFKIKNSEWPTLSDLSKVANQVAKSEMKKKNYGWEKIMDLSQKIERLTENQKKMELWGQKTNINFEDLALTTFDLNQLMESPDSSIKSTQLYILLNYVWNVVLENRRKYELPVKEQQVVVQNISIKLNKLRNKQLKLEKDHKPSKDIEKLINELKQAKNTLSDLEAIWNEKWIAVVFDEAHLMMDKNNNIGVQYLYTMVKRIRKYNGSLITTTQNIKDFTADKNILKETSAILNNVQYFISFGLKPEDVSSLDELRKSSGGLTQSEKDFLISAKRGQSLAFLTPDTRAIMNIRVTAKEKEMMGESLTHEEKEELYGENDTLITD